MRLGVFRRITAFCKSSPSLAAFASVLVLIVVGFIVAAVSDAVDTYRYNHLTSAEHLRLAQEICHSKQFGAICYSTDPSEASRHLEKIPVGAPEYDDATKLREVIRRTVNHNQEVVAQEAAELARLSSQVDRRLARAAAEQSREQEELASRQRQQSQRDDDAQFYSYWPTTLRVNTDMDAFWLPNEERTCQTYPNDKGRVAAVSCTASGSHRDHNIPVKFWGGVDRNIVSDWKCQRNGDTFVCKAVD